MERVARMLSQQASNNVASHVIDSTSGRHPSRAAIIGERGPVSYGELAAVTNQLGNALLRLGCVAGDRVVIALHDSVELVASVFGVVKVGAIAVVVDPSASAAVQFFYRADTAPRFVISHARPGTDVAEQPTGSDVVIESVENTGRAQGWDAIVRQASPVLDPATMEPGDPAVMLYTSGTTGRLKAAVHSHRSLIAGSRNIGQGVFAIDASDRVLCTSRSFFAFGLGFGVYLPLSAGAAIILNRSRSDLALLAQTITEHRPTIVCAVPSLLESLLRAAEGWLPLDLASVRYVVSAGEALPVHIFERFRDRFGVEVLDGLGSTEMLSHVISNRPRHARAGSCGVPVPGIEVALVDEVGTPVGDMEVGTLRVKGDTAFIEYWGRRELTAQARVGEWVVMGDKLYRDADGYYHYCGRTDDMLKVSGLWVLPRDVESAACTHPAVARAVVTTREDPEGRRRLVAYVVPAPNTSLSVSTLLRHLGERLPAHMIPSAFIILAELPLTATGKVRRAELPAPAWGTSAMQSI